MNNHQDRYDQWAPDYNKDVAKRGYAAPKFIVDYLMELAGLEKIKIFPLCDDFKVIDVGCGSGLVGTYMKQNGFNHIDGTDISQGMLCEAYKSRAYNTLIGWQNLRYPLPFFLHKQYDLTICCGVFALDFVEPESLQWLIQVTKPGGIIAMTTKTDYYDTYDFKGYCNTLQKAGEIELVDFRMDQPYLGEEADGHYWVFSVNNKVSN